MSSGVIQLLVLAGIAIFLILKLRSVLGTREGFEKPPVQLPPRAERSGKFEVIEGGADEDIADHAPKGSEAAEALALMKAAEPGFSVGEFLAGARGAYEMIVMAFERGDLAPVKAFLSPEVYESFAEVVTERERRGMKIEANFVGLREIALADADYDTNSREGEITVRFLGELTSAVLDSRGQVVEGSRTEIKRQKDVWTFAREMGTGDPNWRLVATGV